MIEEEYPQPVDLLAGPAPDLPGRSSYLRTFVWLVGIYVFVSLMEKGWAVIFMSERTPVILLSVFLPALVPLLGFLLLLSRKKAGWCISLAFFFYTALAGISFIVVVLLKSLFPSLEVPESGSDELGIVGFFVQIAAVLLFFLSLIIVISGLGQPVRSTLNISPKLFRRTVTVSAVLAVVAVVLLWIFRMR